MRDVMTLSFTNSKGYIFIVRRLEKQSKLILSRLDSISNLKLNLRIHGQCGPDAHAGADLQAFFIFCFKPILISAHKLTLLIYGDNRYEGGRRANIDDTRLVGTPILLQRLYECVVGCVGVYVSPCIETHLETHV